MDIGGGVAVRGVSFAFFFVERFRFFSVGAEEEGTSEGVGSAALEVSMVRLVSIFRRPRNRHHFAVVSSVGRGGVTSSLSLKKELELYSTHHAIPCLQEN